MLDYNKIITYFFVQLFCNVDDVINSYLTVSQKCNNDINCKINDDKQLDIQYPLDIIHVPDELENKEIIVSCIDTSYLNCMFINLLYYIKKDLKVN